MEAARFEIEDLVLHLKGLVLVRGLLELRGASAVELQEHSDEIGRLRDRLARLVQESGGGAVRAAA